MATKKAAGNPAMNTAARIIGRTLGQAAATADHLRERHPDPIAEIREAVDTGRDRLGKARRKGQKAVAKAKKAVAKARKAVAKARRRTARVVKRVKKAARRRR
jgi:hypothetical protein